MLKTLLDESNKEPIVLTDSRGNTMTFEKIAIIPQRGRLYCIFKPLEKMDGLADDEAVVFWIDTSEKENPIVKVELDDRISEEIFEKYYASLRIC
ncbi:MAG: hypothetical protein IKB20_06340 [Clostridia bacterium]|nr:hypothetical protein [Clostridia bacterium]